MAREPCMYITESTVFQVCGTYTCGVADFALCTLNAVVAADRLSFLKDFMSPWRAALTAHRHGHLSNKEERVNTECFICEINPN